MCKRYIYYLFFLVVPVACAKVKPQPVSPLTGSQVLNSPASSIRLFNFYNADLDVKVNNIELTAFSGDPKAAGNQLGLSIFPTNVWPNNDNGSPVTLPATLLDKNQQMHLIIRPRTLTQFSGLATLPVFNIDTVLTNNPLQPNDYYTMADGTLKAIPRNSVSPSNPSSFKFRILNFQRVGDTLGLSGPVVLTYADGTRVNQLDTVTAGAISPYIELPYGSYQFKLFIAKANGDPDFTKQLAELPVYPDMTNFPQNPVQTGLTTRVRGYLPGGTYSIVVTPNILGYDLSGGGNPNFFLINSYRVITEQAAPLNTSWAKMQGVNALSASGISLVVDGQTMGNQLGFGQSSDYMILPQGTHIVQALDGSGKVLASQSTLLYPFDNITAWAYNLNGQPAIVFSNMDMTSTIYEAAATGIIDDGTSGSGNTLHFTYALEMRFLNLSDVPYVTFTDDGNLIQPYLSGNEANGLQSDTVAYPQAYINLPIGQPVAYNPFVIFSGGPSPFTITIRGQTYIPSVGGRMGHPASNPAPVRVYRSQPANGPYSAEVPGSLLQGVPSLTAQYFASGTQIYPNGIPQADNGFFTVALIGSAAITPGSPGAARMIAVKHNK